MNYQEEFTENELKEYEVVKDWKAFAKQYITNQNHDTYISKKIFLEEISFSLEYKHRFTFKGCYFAKSLSFHNCIFHKDFSLIECSIKETLKNESSPTFKAGLIIRRSIINTILISKGNFGISSWDIVDSKNILIDGGEFTNLGITLEGESIESINIVSTLINGDMFITGINQHIQNIGLHGISRKLSLTIYDLMVEHLEISGYINESRLKISNITSNSKSGRINIINSYLGKAEFNSIDFNKFKTVIIEDCQLVDCAFNNISWSRTVYGASPINENEQKTKDFRRFNLKSRETFRQLKYAMSKQGDIINEQKFHSLEMGKYFETLSWGKDFWTKLIIFLSWLTSDFGQSFWRPLLFIFAFHTILFLPLVISGFFVEFRSSSDEFSLKAFGEGINSFFFLMNPFRKVDDNMFKGAWIIIDVFMRISASYMIYNMVRATRRFIK